MEGRRVLYIGVDLGYVFYIICLYEVLNFIVGNRGIFLVLFFYF